MARERDIRSSIRDILVKTGEVPAENIHLCTADEAAGKDGDPLVVAIEPHTTSMAASGAMSAGAGFGRTAAGFDDPPNGMLLFTTQIPVTIISRDPDPETRDNNAELVANYLKNGVNGQILVEGFTSPQGTICKGDAWAKVTDNLTRRLAVTVWCDYAVFGWDQFDTTP